MSAQTVLIDFVLRENFDPSSCEQIVKDMLGRQLAKGEIESNILKVEVRHSRQPVDTVMYSSKGDLMIMIRIDKMGKLLIINIDRTVECSIKSVDHQEISEYQKIQILDTSKVNFRWRRWGSSLPGTRTLDPRL